MNTPDKLFPVAAFYRVSTPRQRDTGSSLEAQRSTVAAAVALHGGKIVAVYGGQEHATPGYDHTEFVRLINDAVEGKFEAIFVAPGDRFSRDTESAMWAIRCLRKGRKRLFIGLDEQNLNSGMVRAALCMKTSYSEIGTDERLDQSVKCRIEQAALGMATSGGELPYGRFIRATLIGTQRDWLRNPDGTAKWEIDQEEKRIVVKAAKLYLSGMTWAEVGKALGVNENTVRRRVLTAGGQWQQRFRLRLGQSEATFAASRFVERLTFEGDYVTVSIPIPPLIDDVTLQRVRAKAAAHYANYKAPNKQVLGGYLRCANCDGSIGTHFHAQSGAIYLQHNGPRLPGCAASFGRYEPFERSFFRRLGSLFQVAGEMEAAVREALLTEMTRQPELENKLQEAKAEYVALKREHDGLYNKMKAFELEDGGAMISRFAADANRLDAQLKAREQEVSRLERELKVTRLPSDFAARIEFTLFCLRGYGTNSRWLWTWPAAQRREMVQFLFGQQSRKPPKGSNLPRTPSGAYLLRKDDPLTGKAIVEWTADGLFPQVSDTVWLDPKVVACYRPAAKGGDIDRKRLVQLIRRLDFSQFRFAQQGFNARKPAGTRAKSSRRGSKRMPPL